MSTVSSKFKQLSKDQKRIIRGWCMYDWANSGFATSAGAAILPVYFVTLFKDAFGPEVDILGFTLTGSSTWSLGVAFSTALVAFSSPILGVIADRTAIKNRLLRIYTIAGALFALLSFFSAYTSAPWAWAIGCFIIANVGFVGGTVFYNSLLPHLASRDLLDDISSRGFAYGYIGGGLLLLIHLVMIMVFSGTEHADLVTRIALGSVGLWWFGWSIWTFRTVPEPPISNPITGLTPVKAAKFAISGLKKSLREIRKFRVLSLFLVSYLLFNDGIQTVLTIAGAFAADTLGISLEFNVATVLIIQFIAAPGAMLFSMLSERISTKGALRISLIGWCLLLIMGIGFAPLKPAGPDDFDYHLKETIRGEYVLEAEPELSDNKDDTAWEESHKNILTLSTFNNSSASDLIRIVSESEKSRFSVYVTGGSLDGSNAIGSKHPSVLGDGLIDWWPETLRKFVWNPLNISVGFQWLILGALAGLVLGGSQALARSLFAQMTPEKRSTEFFSFFGFVGKASAVIGPMIYMLVTGILDTRAAVLMLLITILCGVIMLKWVNVEEGQRIAELEE